MPRTNHPSAPAEPPEPRVPAVTAGCGLAAFVLGLLYALASVYWAAGGTVGLATVGGELERLLRSRATGMVAVVWLTAALKLAGALLGLALARDRRGPLPRWAVPALSWTAAAVLTLYGGVLVAGQVLVQLGAVAPAPDMDWRAFHWHLYLWDPWFLAWGLLLGAAVGARARARRRNRDAAPG